MKRIKDWTFALILTGLSLMLLSRPGWAKLKSAFPEYGKGGVGIISNNVYVVTRTTSNEVLLPGGKRWSGLPSTATQVIYVMDGEVLENPSSIATFELNKAILISFQQSRIYFYDFPNGSGGYYSRRVK